MFLHIGGIYHIPLDSVVCVFDINTSDKLTTKSLMDKAKNENRLFYACEEENACSVIVSRKGNENHLYISQTSAVSLGRRRYSALKAI